MSISDPASPLVSVIIASYNHAPYIEASIQSVLQQEYDRVELFVVDDGSQDDSVTRIRSLQEHYGFNFLVQENKGLVTTLNETIARSSGKYIVPFGSDDIMLPDRLEKQVRHLETNPEVGICAGNILLIDSKGDFLPEKVQRRHSPRRLLFDDLFLHRQPGAPAPTLMFLRSAIDEVGGFDPSVRIEDLFIELKITNAGYPIDVLEDVLAQYRVHPTNTYKNRRLMVDTELAIYDHFKDHPAYYQVRERYIEKMFVKVARGDKALAHELLEMLPLRSYRLKTLKGLFRYWFLSE